MKSNNSHHAKEASSNKITLFNRSQEISSLEDSESTLSHHEQRKVTAVSIKDDKQEIIPSSYPNSFNNNVNSNQLPHRQYQNVTPHESIMNNPTMVTYQNNMNFNPNTTHQMQLQPNYCQPSFFHPTTGMPMHHVHVMNQQNLSHAIH